MKKTLLVQLIILTYIFNGMSVVYAQQSTVLQIANNSKKLKTKGQANTNNSNSLLYQIPVILYQINRQIFVFDEEKAIPLGSLSQSIVTGKSFPNTANFQGQFSSSNKILSGNQFNIDQPIDIFGRIYVDKKNIGQTGEIFIFLIYKSQYFIRSSKTAGWLPWDGGRSSLVAAEAPRLLKLIEDVDILQNSPIKAIGDFFLYFGYWVNDQIFFNKEPLKLSLIDNMPPVITIFGANPISINKGQPYTELGATAKDNVDGTIDVNLSGSVDTNIPGQYFIYYSATDSAGNKTQAKRTVNVLSTNVINIKYKKYIYDSTNKVVKEDLGNGIYIEYTYDDSGNLIQQNIVK